MAAQSREPIRYTLRFPAPQTHYVEIEASYPTGGPAADRSVHGRVDAGVVSRARVRAPRRERQRAQRGRRHRLAIQKSAKNRWRVETGGATTVTVNYRVYGREMTVRNNWIESAFAMLNGAPTFISLVGGLARPHEVRLELAAGWKTSSTALMPVAGQPHTYRAEDFDTLVDSPIILGNSRRARVSSRRQAPRPGARRRHGVLRRRSGGGRHAEDCRGGRRGHGRPLDYPHYTSSTCRRTRAAGSSTRTAFS